MKITITSQAEGADVGTGTKSQNSSITFSKSVSPEVSPKSMKQ